MTAPLWIDKSLVLDARRAVWLPGERTLAVADLHLGYAWAHRTAGNLLPVTAPDETVPRLLALVADYQPEKVVLLGDIVHRAVQAPALIDLLTALLRALRERAALGLVAGNHDRALASLLTQCGWHAGLDCEWRCGDHLLLHGDESDPAFAQSRLDAVSGAGGRIVIGHEHPAITLGDGVATRVKCPCFLLAPNLLVLPAFSPWAAGSDVRARRWLSGYARAAAFEHAVAILGGKLLPVKMN